MRPLLHATLCMLLVLAAVPAAATGTRELQVATLRMAATENTPSGNVESDAIADLNDALTREVCRRLAVRCNQQPMPFAEIIPGVESGRFQLGVGNVLRTPEREERVLFSNMLWRSSSRLVGTPQSIRKHRPEGSSELRLESLRNVRIAVERGTQQQRYVSRVAADNRLAVVETSTVKDALQQLLDGRADFALMPIRSAYFLMLQQPAGAADFAGPALTEQGLGGTVHMILPKGEQALRSEVDAALDAMRRDGTFQRIIRRYMPFLAD
jgi:ABC-type amino acid transport substrate-binding protein